MGLKQRVERLEGGVTGAGWRRWNPDPAAARAHLAALIAQARAELPADSPEPSEDEWAGTAREVLAEIKARAARFDETHEFKTQRGVTYIRERG